MPMKCSSLLKLAFSLVLTILLTACQSMNGAVGGYFDLDTDLQIDFKVDADINPDELGKPSPVFIRMYELKDKKMMGKADFISIYERDKEVLGADMIESHKLRRFTPGETRTEHFVLDKNSNYVALYAEFLEFRQSKFKLIIPVVANNVFRNSVTVHVSGNKLVFDQPVDEDLNDQKADANSTPSRADNIKSSSDKSKKYF